MADTLQVFQVLVPAGTLISAPATTLCPLGISQVRRILITWPPGCGGLVGAQVRAAGGFAFPNKPTQFMAFDDYTYPFDVANQIDSGQWSVVCNNVDAIDHLLQVVFEYDYVQDTSGITNLTPVSL